VVKSGIQPCAEGRCGDYWGCLKESDARPSGYEETYEVYGLQVDGSTKWVMGDVQFEGESSGRVGTFHHVILCSQNTVRLMSASMVHVCNQSDTRE
jgi:hypothetical protein